eukprot:1172902-Prorocentrum_minimum.AAC.1
MNFTAASEATYGLCEYIVRAGSDPDNRNTRVLCPRCLSEIRLQSLIPHCSSHGHLSADESIYNSRTAATPSTSTRAVPPPSAYATRAPPPSATRALLPPPPTAGSADEPIRLKDGSTACCNRTKCPGPSKCWWLHPDLCYNSD